MKLSDFDCSIKLFVYVLKLKLKFVHKTHMKPHKCTIRFIAFHSICGIDIELEGCAREFCLRWLAVCKWMCECLSHEQTNLIGCCVFKTLHCTLNSSFMCNKIIYSIWIRLMIGGNSIRCEICKISKIHLIDLVKLTIFQLLNKYRWYWYRITRVCIWKLLKIQCVFVLWMWICG